MFEQAREYLARVVPWPQEGEETSYVNLHWTEPNLYDPKKKPFFRGKPFTDVSSAIGHLEYLTTKGNALDIYVCMSSQRTHEIKRNASTGKEFTIAVRGQGTAVKLKSLFIDLDAKGEDKNSYADVIEASKALAKFLQDTGLPKPSLLVFSGGGLHVYWTLMLALDPAAWTQMAFALAEATKRHGLKCDTQCTTDSARVLRVPGTKNHKPGLVSDGKVRIAGKPQDFDYANERIERVLEPYKVAVPKLVTTEARDFSLFPVRAPLKEPSALAMGVDTSKYDPLDLDLMLPECPWLNDVVTTGGKDVSNPLWSITTLIATFCSDARNQAHRMGCQHPGYEQETTDELFDRKVSEQKSKNLGWPSCQAISITGAKQCQTCPHLAVGKSPLNFGIVKGGGPPTPPITTASCTLSKGSVPGTVAPSINDLPNGYSRRHDGIILENITLPNNTTKQSEVCNYVMDAPWLQKDPNILHFTTVTDKGNTKQITIETRDVGGMTMRSILQEQGLMIASGKGAETMWRFLVAWIQKLQQTRESVKSNPFGWTVKGGSVEGFVYGGQIWTPGGSSPSANPDPVLQRQYQPCGDIAPWRAAGAMVLRQGRPDLAAILASAFAAPLVRFTGEAGVLMSAYSSQSGIGKSTALKIAQAVWGDPIQALQSLTDTQNSVMGKLGQIKNLPLYWDELKTDEDTRKFINVAFQITIGKEKSRMRANTSLRDPGTWQTLIVSASNDSLLDFVVKQTNTTTAGIYRIFEYVVSPAQQGGAGQLATAEAALITSQLNDNFGVVGLEYAKYLGNNHARVALDVRAYLNALGLEVATKPDERFWLALIACVMVGAGYANQLGFTSFDLGALKAFMLSVLDKMRKEINTQPVDMSKDINVSDVFAQYVSAMRARHTLWTNRIHVGRGKPGKPAITIQRGADRLEDLFVQIGLSDKRIQFVSTSFHDWYKEKYGKGASIIIKELEKQFGMSKTNGRVGAGTVFNTPSLWYYEIDLGANNILNEFLDGQPV